MAVAPRTALALSVGDVLLYVFLAAAGFVLVVIVCVVLLSLINLVLPSPVRPDDEADGFAEHDTDENVREPGSHSGDASGDT